MTTYTLYTNGVLEKDDYYLPIDESNADYLVYVAWLALGNSPTIKQASEYVVKLDAVIANKAQARAEYLATIATLQGYEDVVNPTNAQVVAGVKFLAKTLKLTLKLIVKSLL